MMTASSIATAPGALPLLGHLVRLLRDPLGFVRSLPEHGDLVRIRLGPLQAIMVCDPDLTRQVLLDDRTFDKGGPVYDWLREVAGNGLGSCPHSEHRRQRRLLQPAFHPSRLRGYAQAMTTQLVEVTGAWRDGQVLDVLAEMQTITMRVTAETLFSNTLPAPVVHQALDDLNAVVTGMVQRMIMPPPLDRLPTPGNRRYQKARVRLRHTLSGIIADRRESGTDRGDLLSALLAARDPDTADTHQGLSDAEICDQIVTFFLAGAETTATALTWALHLLAQHPDIEERLYAEIDPVLDGGAAAYEHLPHLKLTSRVITETLRLYPPAWLVTRSAVVDTHVGGQPIPAGTIIAWSPYLIHYRPDLYPDPERFDPDRWDGTHRKLPPRDAFIPFGTGPRKCIGDQFGMIEATLGLATIAARWHLGSLSGQPLRPRVGISLHPHGRRMRAVARTHKSGTIPRTDNATTP
jgi:pentalenene oxygenase